MGMGMAGYEMEERVNGLVWIGRVKSDHRREDKKDRRTGLSVGQDGKEGRSG